MIRCWHFIFKFILAVAVVLTALSTPLVAQATDVPIDPADLEAFMDGVMSTAMQEHHVPGATLAVVQGGEIVLAQGYGYADLAGRVPVDAERTLFRPGSVTKLVTWTAVMQLVEAGKIDMEADINTYLDFEIPATYPEPITMENLMTHTPGFEDWGSGLFGLSEEERIPLGEFLERYLPTRVYPPGELVAYSNYGTALAGYIVERVSGEPFEQYVENHIFEPLGMDHSTFVQPLPAALAADMAGGYNYLEGSYLEGGFEFVRGTPAGALSSTAIDMARFMIAHLQGGRYGDARILEEETVERMHSRLFAAHPEVSGMAHGFMESTINGERVITHGGDTFLFHSALYLLPEHDVGLFVSFNATGGASIPTPVMQSFMDRYFPAPLPPAPAPPADFAVRAARYAGEYYPSRTSYTSAEKFIRLTQVMQVSATDDGYLLVNFQGNVDRFVEVAPHLFRNVLRDEVLVFDVDASGEVVGIFFENAPAFPFIKAAFYESTGFHALLLGGTIVLFIISAVGWIVAWFVNRRQREARPLPAIAARWWAVAFGVLTLTFLVALGAVMTPHPAYGVPEAFFGITPALNRIMLLPFAIVTLAAGLVAFTVVAWLGVGNAGKPYWSFLGRLHYTLLALLSLSVVWEMFYWRMLSGF